MTLPSILLKNAPQSRFSSDLIGHHEVKMAPNPEKCLAVMYGECVAVVCVLYNHKRGAPLRDNFHPKIFFFSKDVDGFNLGIRVVFT